MSNMIKAIKRIQQDNFKKVVLTVIEKIQGKSLDEEEIMKIINESMTELLSSQKPQRMKSGYNVFVSEKSAELKAGSKDKIAFKDISKKISEMWKAMSDEEKEVYQEKAKNMPVEQKKICAGTKGDGTACVNKAKTNSEFCGQHMPKEEKGDEDNSNKCKAKTKKGNDCTRHAQEGSDLCKMHLANSSKQETSSSNSEKKPCEGLTKKKEICKRSAVIGKYCKKHAEQYGITSEAKEAIPDDSFPRTIKIADDTANLITFQDKKYYLGENDNICYSATTHAEVGYWDADKEIIIYD